MPRKRVGVVVDLPSEVHVVHNAKSGKTYYYWAPGRGTARAGERERIPGTPAERRFWQRLEELKTGASAVPAGSIAALVRAYRASQEFRSTTASTQAAYEVTLRRFETADAWGLMQSGDLQPIGVVAMRDAMAETPSMANQMLSVGRTLWDWAIPLGLLPKGAINPFEKVRDLVLGDRGHVPWPAWAQDMVIASAPVDIVRFVRLALMTGQRESDLILFGPDHREGKGLWCRPIKTSRKRRAFYITLSTADAIELDRWATTPMTFENSRWKAPRPQLNPDFYLYTPRGEPYTTTALRSRWNRWLATKDGQVLCKAWREWMEVQVKRYGWDLDPEDIKGPTLHGLRGACVVARRVQGYEQQAIANDIGMSPQMVQHYTRFMDQMDAAEANRRRFEVVR